MRISHTQYSFTCNICGKVSERTINLPIGWREFEADIHYCPECQDKFADEPIDLTKAVIGDRFLTRSGREAVLVSIMPYHKRPYVFADREGAWSTSWNGFVCLQNSNRDIVKKLK